MEYKTLFVFLCQLDCDLNKHFFMFILLILFVFSNPKSKNW